METLRLLAERPLLDLLRQALAAHVEGLVALRTRDGLRHGVWVQRGYVVGAHVAGEFDPLLALLWRRGALSADAHERCLRLLAATGARAGAIAERAGVERPQLFDALRAQLVARFAALLELATLDGHDARFEACAIPEREHSVRMPLGSLLRRLQASALADRERAAAPQQALQGPPHTHVTGSRAPERGASAHPHDAEQERDPAAHRDAEPERDTAARRGTEQPELQASLAREQREAGDARRRLRALAKVLHPDLHGAHGEDARRRAHEAFARATASYHGFS